MQHKVDKIIEQIEEINELMRSIKYIPKYDELDRELDENGDLKYREDLTDEELDEWYADNKFDSDNDR